MSDFPIIIFKVVFYYLEIMYSWVFYFILKKAKKKIILYTDYTNIRPKKENKNENIVLSVV